MRLKHIKTIALIALCCLLIGIGCSWTGEEEIPELLTWDRSGCRMLDYELDGDRITIRYCVRIVSHDPQIDWELSNFTLYFSPEETSGWLKYRDYYLCTLESGEHSVIIPGGETIDVVLLLEGERFPDEIPTDPPEIADLRYMLSVAD